MNAQLCSLWQSKLKMCRVVVEQLAERSVSTQRSVDRTSSSAIFSNKLSLSIAFIEKTKINGEEDRPTLNTLKKHRVGLKKCSRHLFVIFKDVIFKVLNNSIGKLLTLSWSNLCLCRCTWTTSRRWFQRLQKEHFEAYKKSAIKMQKCGFLKKYHKTPLHCFVFT